METSRVPQVNSRSLFRDVLFSFIALVSVVFLVQSEWMISHIPYTGMIISQEGIVRRVAADSPTEKAGIIPGDIIVAVNGHPLAPLESPFAGLRAGEWAVFTIVRDSEIVPVLLKMDQLPLSEMADAQEQIILGFLIWIISIFVWLGVPSSSASNLFFLLGQIAAIVFAADAISTFGWRSLGSYLFVIFLLVLVTLLAHFYLVFPHPRKGRFYRIYLVFLYGMTGIVVLAYSLDFFTAMQNQWLHSIASQWIYYVILILVLTIGSLFVNHHGATIHSGRQRRLLTIAMVLSILPLLLFSALPHVLMGQPVIAYLWTRPLFLLLPISYVYVVRAEHLDQFDRILKSGLTLLLLIVIFLMVYLLFLGGFYGLHLPDRWIHLSAAALMILLAILTISPLKRRIYMVLDRMFYGQWYDYRSIIQQNSRYLSGMIRQDELAENLLQNARTMRFKEAILLHVEDKILRPYKYFGYSPEAIETFFLNVDEPLVKQLRQVRKPCSTRALLSSAGGTALPSECRRMIEDARIQVWLPFLTRQGELVGLLALGQRQANEGLDKEDWAILNTLMDQTSLAAENIQLVEMLRDQLNMMQQMQQELKETKWRLAENRERERLELARILHDGPIQDIYGIYYHLEIWRKQHDMEHDPELEAIEAELMNVEKTLRFFSTELRPPALESFGLEGAIRAHISKIQESNEKPEILPELIATKDIISYDKKLGLFRIYQEAMYNALRHAGASKVWVRLYMDDGKLFLEVEDNGRGFNVPEKWMEFARKGHLGLLGIAERAEAVGGQLQVHSSPGEGALVRVSILVEPSGQASIAPPTKLHNI